MPPNAADAFADDDPNTNLLYDANNCPNAATGAGVQGFFTSNSGGAGCKDTPCCYYGTKGQTDQCKDYPVNTGNLNFNAQGSSTQLLVNQSPNTVSDPFSQLSDMRKPIATSNLMFCHLKLNFLHQQDGVWAHRIAAYQCSGGDQSTYSTLSACILTVTVRNALRWARAVVPKRQELMPS